MPTLTSGHNELRFDLKVIGDWIEPNAKVLDLGCGKGDLLLYLKNHKQASTTGVDNKEDNISACIEKGLTVIQGDINCEVDDYPDEAFDYVILSQTLQQVYAPSELLRVLLRIGKRVIVSFPNFSHWRVRMQLLLTGYAPVTDQLPYEWYDTPNIRVITIKDFRKYTKRIGSRIYREIAVKTNHREKEGKIVHVLPEWFATYGIFMIGSPERK